MLCINVLLDGVSNLPGEVEDQETADEEGKLELWHEIVTLLIYIIFITRAS